MPSKTAKQAAAMRAACHSNKPPKSGKKGIPKKVACEFVRADSASRAKKRSKG